MSAAIFTGVIEGAAIFGANGSVRTVPFQNNLEGLTLSYNGQLELAETFSNRGVSGATGACLVSEEVTLTTETSNISWAMMQMCLASVAEAVGSTVNRNVEETILVPVVTPAGTASYTLSNTPAVGTQVLLADSEGNLVSGFTVISGIPVSAQGTLLTAIYQTAMPAGGENEVIYLGAGQRLSEASLYGRFHLCGSEPSKFGSLSVFLPRAVIQPKLELGVKKGSKAQAMAEFKVLRGNVDGKTGVYAAFYKTPAL
jgi:hypothetical protein